MYTSTQPCIHCTKAIISAGIRKVIYIEKYNDELSLKLLKQAGVEVLQYKENECL
jgi:dCMP deaminase